MSNPSSAALPRRSLATVVAVIGCDGAGKSTLVADLARQLGARRSTELMYLGQSSGRIGEWIAGLPVLGRPLAKWLARKAKRTHAGAGSARAPRGAAALAIYLLSKWRAHKFRGVIRGCRRGNWIVTDRYPQAEQPDFHFDGPGLDPARVQGWWSRHLAAREGRLYAWMASHVPALIVRLNIDAATAHRRKPDHDMAALQQKVDVLPRLDFNGARILDLDATDPYEKVLEAALAGALEALAGASNVTARMFASD